MPKRIQLRRTKGWRKPAGAVVVARPSRWGNPVRVRPPDVDRALAVSRYRQIVAADPTIAERARAELRGRDLCCWCPPSEPCHADVLLEMANAEVTS